jgi:hypothetical protein
LKDATAAADRRTATPSKTSAHTPTLPKPPTASACMGSHINHPRNVIMREEVLIHPLDTWLASALS